MMYYALGPNCWGFSDSVEKAVKLAAKNWPEYHPVKKPKKEHFSIWETTAKQVEVSQMNGSATVEHPHDLVKIQTSSLVKAKA